jgi:hypothetical protein
LYDKVVFEEGVYWSMVGPEGSLDGIRPLLPSDQKTEFTDEHPSDHFWIRIKPTGAGPDVPFTTVLHSPLRHYHKSNFHPLIGEIRAAGITQVDSLPITMLPIAKSEADKLSARALTSFPTKEDESWLHKIILRNLYLDLLLICDLRWPACLDAMHSSYVKDIARGRFHTHTPPGFLSLELTFPNVGNFPWEAIGQLRSEESVLELRRKLIDVEANARALLGQASTEEIRGEVARSLIGELVEEVFKGRGGIGKILGAHVGAISLEVLGSVFPPLSLVEIGLETALAMKGAIEHERLASSWIAGFMKLASIDQSGGQ